MPMRMGIPLLLHVSNVHFLLRMVKREYQIPAKKDVMMQNIGTGRVTVGII